jgi:hypothetical protein
MDEKIYMRHTGYRRTRTLTAKVLQAKNPYLGVEKSGEKECSPKIN